MNNTSRRDLLRSSAALAAGSLAAPALFADTPAPGSKRSLRVVHMTDMHIQPELAGDQGVAACFKHIQAMADKPSLILTGGDTIMDGFEHDHARTESLWKLWNSVAKSEAPAPLHSALGNHDIWGWNKSKSKTKGDEHGWGKAWACEQFGRDKPYTSFDSGAWHFVILDSIRPDKDDPNGYEAFLDDEQFAWLEKDLAGTTRPTLVLSHAPILSVTPHESLKPTTSGDLEISGGKMHTDFARIEPLFRKSPNVKACISGHIHLLDRVEFNGVQYFCNGAVSGAWWKGDHKTCKPGYAVLDLFEDGSLTNQYVPYGWSPKA